MSQQSSTTDRGAEVSHWKIVALLAGLTVVFFHDVFLRGRVFYWGDIILQAYPWHHFIKDMLHRGELPLWNPYIFCGLPFVANPQPGIFYPLGLVALALPSAVAISVDAALHVFLAGLFMFLYLKQLGRSETASLIGALGFMFGGFLIVKLQFQSTYRVLSWMPCVLWRTECLLQDTGEANRWTNLRHSLLLGMVLAMQWLGGQLQVALLAVMFWTFYVVAGVRSRRSGKTVGWALFLPVLLMVGLTAVQWLPTVEFARLSTRTQLDFAKAMAFSLPPWQLPTLVIPNLFGNPQFNNYWGAGNYFEVCGYVGMLTLLLAWFGARRGGTSATETQRDESLRKFWIGMSIVGLMLAMGGFSPVYRAVYRWIPLFHIFRAPARFMLWYVFSVPCLAAIGWDAFAAVMGDQSSSVRQGWLKQLKWIGIGAVSGLLLLLLAYAPASAAFEGFVRFCFAHTDKSAPARQVHELAASLFGGAMLFLAVSLVLFFLSYAALLTVSRSGSGFARARWGVVGVLVADLFVFGMKFNPTTSPRVFNTKPDFILSHVPPHKSQVRVLLPLESINRLWSHYYSYSGFGSRDEKFIRTPLRYGIPCFNMAHGIYNAEGYDPIRFLPYDKKLREYEAELQLYEMACNVTPRPNTAGVRQSAQLSIKTPDPPLPDKRPVLWAPYDASGVPRAFIAYGSQAALRTEPWLSDGKNRVQFSAKGVRAGAMLNMSDILYPDWRAAVNGKPVPIRPYHGIFRRLILPQGDVSGEFVYYPTSFKVGLFVSLCFLAGVVGTATVVRSGNRTRMNADAADSPL